MKGIFEDMGEGDRKRKEKTKKTKFESRLGLLFTDAAEI